MGPAGHRRSRANFHLATPAHHAGPRDTPGGLCPGSPRKHQAGPGSIPLPPWCPLPLPPGLMWQGGPLLGDGETIKICDLLRKGKRTKKFIC